MSWSSWGWDTLTSISATANQMVNDLAEAIDVEGEEGEQKDQKETPSGEASEAKTEPKEGEEAKEGEEQPAAPSKPGMQYNSPLISLFVGNKKSEATPGEEGASADAGVFGFFSSGAEYLGNTIQHGVNTLQNSEVDLSMFTPVAAAGFGALESLGAAALSVLTVEDTTSGDKPRMKPIWTPMMENLEGEVGADQKTEKTAESGNDQGKSHMEALEHYSIECMMNTQKCYHHLDLDARDAVDDIIGSIQDIFDEEYKDETVSVSPLDLDQNIKKEWDQLVGKFGDVTSQIKTLNEAFTVALTETKSAAGDAVANVSEFAEKKLDEVRGQCITQLGELTVDCIKQFGVTADAFLKEKTYGKEAKVLEKAKYICTATKFLDQELTSVSGLYISVLGTIIADAEAAIAEVQQAEGEQTNKDEKIADLKKKLAASKNKIIVSVSSGISNIEEAKKFLLPVCKFLVVQAPEAEPAPAAEETKVEAEPETKEPTPAAPAIEEPKVEAQLEAQPEAPKSEEPEKTD